MFNRKEIESIDTLRKLVKDLSDNTSTQVQQKPINLTYASLLAGNAGSGQPPNKEPFAGCAMAAQLL